MMNRREFMGTVTGGLLTPPLAVEAQQQTTRRPLVGFLCNTTKVATAFGEGLRELGYVDGRNIFVEYRCAEGRTERGQQLAAALLKLKPDVLVAASDPLVKVLVDATHTIPIVMTSSGDPVGNRFVASFARPGGNVTGVSMFAPELAGKRLELLKTVDPEITQVAVLVNPTNPNASRQLGEIEAAAQTIGARLKILRVRLVTDFDNAFSGIGQTSVTALALLISSDALFFAERRRIAAFALANRLPAMGFAREFAEDGTLLAYGPSLPDLYRRAAYFVDRILRGAKPADLPVEQPTKFELIINMKTAKSVGLTIPPSLLLRADQLIE
jgi:putative ABC transport system substrate-binding protein